MILGRWKSLMTCFPKNYFPENCIAKVKNIFKRIHCLSMCHLGQTAPGDTDILHWYGIFKAVPSVGRHLCMMQTFHTYWFIPSVLHSIPRPELMLKLTILPVLCPHIRSKDPFLHSPSSNMRTKWPGIWAKKSYCKEKTSCPCLSAVSQQLNSCMAWENLSGNMSCRKMTH